MAVYSALLGIYSIGIQNIVFVVVNFGAAILSAAVAIAGQRIRRSQARAGGR